MRGGIAAFDRSDGILKDDSDPALQLVAISGLFLIEGEDLRVISHCSGLGTTQLL
jgi:hypothetical protein